MSKPEYIRQVKHATSVKNIFVVKDFTDSAPGIGDFDAKPVFSVFDYGTIEPPIPLDNSTIVLMGGLNFENLREQGIESHYIGLVTDKGELISAKEAISRKIAPTITRVKLVNRITPEFKDGVWDYSMFEYPNKNNYVLPIEFISRNELGENSSVWKRVEKGQTTMQDLGLPADFKPGDKVPEHLKPIPDYSTKFEPDDRYLTPSEVQAILHVSDDEFKGINNTTKKASNIMTKYAASRGFKRDDGKIEQVVILENGQVIYIIGDTVCSWHEDRLKSKYGVGISKQRIRSKIIQLNGGWYNEIQRAKQQAIDDKVADFRTLMNPDIKYTSPSVEFFEAINTLFRAGTNQWVGVKVYNIYPDKNESLEDNLARACEEFQKVK